MANSNLDVTKLKKAVEAQIPLSITTYTLPHEMELYMAEVLAAFLKELGQSFMTEYLVYCMNELVTNAKKANTKRVYFKEKCLDINNPDDYALGMKTFKKDTLSNSKYWLALQKKAGYYIKTVFQVKNSKIRLEIKNNSVLTQFEFMRIHDKIERSKEYQSIEDPFSKLLDDTEGAGLGIIIMILMLRKIGLSDDNFVVFSENGETITRIILPLNISVQEDLSKLSQNLVDLIDNLPQFSENITKIVKLLNNPNSKMSDIARYISNDVALTADLLKLANSAAFSRQRPCTSIHEAVKMVGIKGLQNMLLSIGAIQSLGSSTVEQKMLWNHSSKVAFFSYNLARNYCANCGKVIDDSYVCGLLHDMGRVVFESAHPALLQKFKETCNQKAITTELFEKLTSGTNHAQIGAEIAKKWNFPESIIVSIQYHHSPEEAPEEYKMLTAIVYIANMISHFQEGAIEFYQFDPKILKMINIENKKQLEELSIKLKLAYNHNTK